jgi:signal transduction histidine kinase
MDLRSQALESRDLAGALADLAEQTTRGTGATASVVVEGQVQRLDASHEHHLLRIGLEAVTNALKHSGARQIDILLRFGPDSTELIVQDDGRGFNIAAQDLGGAHFGLQGIRERVDKLGGVLHIESAAHAGARLSVMVPSRGTEAAAGVAHVLDESWRTS